jgi:hypothetical protein
MYLLYQGQYFEGLGGAILDEEYQLNKSSAYNHWHAAARIFPGMVPECGKFHVGNGRNLPNGQRRSRRRLFNGPCYGCDYPVRPGVGVEFCPSGAGRGPPAPPRLCAAGTDVLIAARVRSPARRSLADMVVRGLPLLHPTRPIMRC